MNDKHRNTCREEERSLQMELGVCINGKVCVCIERA